MTVREHRLLAQSVFITPARAVVALRSAPSGLPPLAGPCPFCPGEVDEHATVRLKQRTPEGDELRILANRYPLLDEAEGSHELVIESNEHLSDITTYPAVHTAALLRLVRDRVATHLADTSLDAVHVFRNRGLRSGASQPHPHLQLVASRVRQPDGERRLAVAEAFHRSTGAPLFDRVVEEELSDPGRTVLENEGWRAVVPFAPLRNYEVWVVPKRERGLLVDATDESLAQLAELLGPTTRAALEASGCHDYNLLFRTLPARARGLPFAYHLVEIVPRGTMFAGFELLTAGSVVVQDPVDYATRMRDALRHREGEALP